VTTLPVKTGSFWRRAKAASRPERVLYARHLVGFTQLRISELEPHTDARSKSVPYVTGKRQVLRLCADWILARKVGVDTSLMENIKDVIQLCLESQDAEDEPEVSFVGVEKITI